MLFSAVSVGCSPDLGRVAGGLDVYVAGVDLGNSLDLEVKSQDALYQTRSPFAALGGKLSVESVPTGLIEVRVSVTETGDAKTATATIQAEQRTTLFMSFGGNTSEGFVSQPIQAVVRGLHGVQGVDDTAEGSGTLDHDALLAYLTQAESVIGAPPVKLEVRELRLVLDSTVSAPYTQLKQLFVNFVSVTMSDPSSGGLAAVEIAGGAPPSSGNEGTITVGLTDLSSMMPALRAGNVSLHIRGQTPSEHLGMAQVKLGLWVKFGAKL